MAIVQISKVEARKGLFENLPQLGSAQFGWALDNRKLFIGNGTIAEGAPTIGNTEILTEHSNLLALMDDAYIFRAENLDYPVTTGVNAATPISRSLNARMDEQVSVAGFGANGDGTDQTDAINRALTEVFRLYPADNKSRVALHFPAGDYLYTGVLQIPAYAIITGAGKNNTRLIQATANGSNPFVEIVKLINVNGGGSFINPAFIYVRDIAFDTNTFDNDVLRISSAEDVMFERCSLIGHSASTLSIENDTAVVKLDSPDLTKTARILFHKCDLSGATNGVVADHDMSQIIFEGGTFHNLFKGLKLGESTTGSGSAITGPSGVRIINNMFDMVSHHGIHVFMLSKVVSSMNYFKNVGNTQGVSPATPIVVMGDWPSVTAGTTTDPAKIDPVLLKAYSGNLSIGDQFDRTDADALVYSTVDIFGTASYVVDGNRIRFGSLRIEPGRSFLLKNNTSSAVTTGIELDVVKYQGIIIDYVIHRQDSQRVGVLHIAQNSLVQSMDEEYTDAGTNIGMLFNLSYAAGVSKVMYTSSGTGWDAVLKYSVRHFDRSNGIEDPLAEGGGGGEGAGGEGGEGI